MNKEEKTIEKIALLLAKLKTEGHVEFVAAEAANMAIRAKREWWVMPGKPYFNERMAHLKRKLNK